MRDKQYSAAAVKFMFWLPEMQMVCDLLASGMTMREVQAKNDAENIFSAPSKERAKTVMSVISKRLDICGKPFIKMFRESDVEGQKQLCMIACMCTDALFFDFVYKLVHEKLVAGLNEFGADDIRRFWKEECSNSEKVATFTDATKRNLTKVYKRYLYEAGITDANKWKRKIVQPVIAPYLKTWLRRKQWKDVLEVLTGEK